MTQGTPAGTAPADGQMGGNGALWGGRFEARPAEFLQRYGASLPFDKRMWAEDIAGSKAHAAMLAKVGVVSAEDADAIRAGLDAVGADIAAGDFSFDINDEDIHMSVERSLTERIGAAGGRLHTGRSRNDQVALDDRLVTRRAARELHAKVLEMRAALLERAEGEFGVVMPGYTHMQKAQPVLFSHHMLAYYWMFARDTKRLRDAYDAAERLPARQRGAGGHDLPARSRHGGRGARVRRHHRELDGRGERPRLLLRPRLCLCDGADAPVAPVRGARVVVERRVSLRHAWTTPIRPGRPSCRRRRTPTLPS